MQIRQAALVGLVFLAFSWTACSTSTDSGVSDTSRLLATASPTSAAADGRSPINIDIFVQSRTGSPIVGAQIVLSAQARGLSLVQPAASDANGFARGSVVGSVVGTFPITATLAGTATQVGATATVAVTFVPPADSPTPSITATLQATPSFAVANGASPIALTVQATASDGASLAGMAVAFGGTLP